MMGPECRRWTDLSDRHALEEPLTEEERSFLHAHPDTCPACAEERSWWDGLTALQVPGENDREPPAGADGPLTEPSRPPHRWLAVAAAAAAAGLGWWGGSRSIASSDTLTTGLARPVASATAVASPAPTGGSWRAVAATGEGIASVEAMADTGDIATGDDSHVCFRHDLGIVACAAPGTRAILHGYDAQPWVALSQGRVVIELESRDLAAAFFVQTPSGRATALGTMFSVETKAAGDALRVTHGRVRWSARAGATPILVAAGEAVDPQGKRVLSSAEIDEDRWLLRGAMMWKGGPSAVVAIDRPDPACRASVAGRRFGAERLWLRLPPGSRELAWEGCTGHAGQTLEVEAGQRIGLGAEPTAEKTPTRAPDGSPTASAHADGNGSMRLLAQAQSAQARGELAVASAHYAELLARFPQSAEASVARLARGRLLLQQGRAQDALAAFDAYLAQGGGLGQEARLGRIQALGLLGRDAERAKAITDFVARYPDTRAARALQDAPPR